MRRKMKRCLSVILAMLLMLSLAACAEGGDSGSGASTSDGASDASPEGNAGGEERKLVIWQTAMTSTAELEKPEEEWTFTQICRDFEEQNPGVTIEFVFDADQQVAQNKLKAAVLANNAPDIANLYSGYLVTSLSDIFLDITEYIPEEDLELITGWEAVSKDLVMGNPIYGYPAAGAEMGMLIYNKSLVEQAGVDLEGDNAPKNPEELREALRQIKAAGILPIVGSDKGYNPLFVHSFGSWWTQQVGTDHVTSNSLGKTKFAEDTAFIESLSFVASFYEEELVNQDYATLADPLSVFLAGDAAMFATGNWDLQTCMDSLGVENVGMYLIPDFNEDVKYKDAKIGGVGQALCVTTNCEDPQLAVDFLSFLSNKENVISMTKVLSKIPQRTDITPADIGWEGNEVFERMLEEASNNLLPWNDNAMQSDVMNEFYKQTTLAVIGDISAQECAELLDAKAAEVN